MLDYQISNIKMNNTKSILKFGYGFVGAGVSDVAIDTLALKGLGVIGV